MNTESITKILDGKTINFIGDSLFAAHALTKDASWCNKLAKAHGMTFQNYGISGCTVSACAGGSYPIVERYGDMEDNDPDIVVIEGGRNDFNKHAVIKGDDSDITTYRGALITLVRGLREKYPRALLIGVSFWRSGTRINDLGHLCSEYTETMIETLRELNVEVIDTTDTSVCPVNMLDPEFRKQYCVVPGDVCHLNDEGMTLAVPYFEAEIAKICTRVWGNN